MNDSAIIALSFCMIVFPTFIIIPSAFALYKRIADFYFTGIQLVSFGIAALSLIIATIYTNIALFSTRSVVTYSLGILLVLITIGILLFLYKLHEWLWELALANVFSDSEAAESG